MGNENKSARKSLEELYGKGCFIERAGIRFISREEEKCMKKKLRLRKRLDRTITYHHIKPKSKGGRATIENGANMARYNHDWLESLPQEQRDKVNERLQQFKLNIDMIRIRDKGIETSNPVSIDLNFDFNDFIEIPVYDDSKLKYNRAKEKEELRRIIKEENYR